MFIDNQLESRIPTKGFFIVFLSTLLVSCGGGGSNSGVAQAPLVAPKFFEVGTYTGTLTLELQSENFESEPTDTRLRLEVSGVAGSQQVSVRFTQFSGSSSIDQNGGFSIPSGQFSLPLREPSGSRQVLCTGELIFDGTFVDSSVSGQISGDFTCPEPFGAATAVGSFSATLGEGKLSFANDDFRLEVIAR